MKKFLFILLIIPFFAGAVEILPIPQHEGFFARVWRCKLSISCYREPKLGVSLTTITGNTLVSDLDTIIMANDNALNNGKIENSTTSVAAITTLPGLTTANALTSATALVSVGTLTTGVWNGTPVGATWGGTGSSTLSANQVLLGNGTTQLKVVSGLGTSGQFLQSAGAGLPPVWAASAVNEAANYLWTGTNSWSGQSTFASSSASTSVMSYWVATSTTGTSTANNGINLLGGCYAKNGVCAPTISTSSASSGLATGDSTETTVTPTCSSGKAISGGYELFGGGLGQSASHYAVNKNIKITDTAWRITVACVTGGGCLAGTITGNVTCMSY